MSLLEELAKAAEKTTEHLADFVRVSEKELPATPEGFKRFYRAQGPVSATAEMSEGTVGKYFTPALDSAFRYAAEQPNRNILAVDVALGDVQRYGLHGYEHEMPDEIVERAQPYMVQQTRVAIEEANRLSQSFLSKGHSTARSGLPVRTIKY